MLKRLLLLPLLACSGGKSPEALSVASQFSEDRAAVQQACMDAIDAKQHDLPPEFQWISQDPNVRVLDAVFYPGSPRTGIYVHDKHAPDEMKQVSLFVEAAKDKGVRHVDLEGVEGDIPLDREREIAAKIDEYNGKNAELVARYLKFTPDMFRMPAQYLGLLLDTTGFSEFSSPARGYLDLFNDDWDLELTGVEDQKAYARHHLADKYKMRAILLDELKALRGKTREEMIAENPIFTRIDGRVSVPDYAENILADPEGFDAFIAHVEALQRAVEAEIGEVPSGEKVEQLSVERGETAVTRFIADLEVDGVSAGILIYGLGHADEIVASFQEAETSYISVQARSIVPAECAAL